MKKSFKATTQKSGSKVLIRVPFDPDDVWGPKPRHYVHGTVNGEKLRALLKEEEGGFVISIGASFRRDTGIEADTKVKVSIEPEGPQLDNIGDDVAQAISSDPKAANFFNGLATHYRKNYINWIEEAKRPETRAKRIKELIKLLKDGRQKK